MSGASTISVTTGQRRTAQGYARHKTSVNFSLKHAAACQLVVRRCFNATMCEPSRQLAYRRRMKRHSMSARRHELLYLEGKQDWRTIFVLIVLFQVTAAVWRLLLMLVSAVVKTCDQPKTPRHLLITSPHASVAHVATSGLTIKGCGAGRQPISSSDWSH